MISQSYTVVTTWGDSHWDIYAKRCIESIIKFWPDNVKKFFYPDNPKQIIRNKNCYYFSLNEVQSSFNSFKLRNINDNFLKRKLQTDPFLFDVIRFSHKVYAILDAAERCDTDQIIWLDADTVTYKPIKIEWLEKITPKKSFTSYLGRPQKGYSECGFISFNLASHFAETFFSSWRSYYDQDLYKTLDGFTDCHTYDAVRLQMTNDLGLKSNDLNDGRFYGYRISKHPFINSELGNYIDHLKGPRKKLKSSYKDLKRKRNDAHWS